MEFKKFEVDKLLVTSVVSWSYLSWLKSPPRLQCHKKIPPFSCQYIHEFALALNLWPFQGLGIRNEAEFQTWFYQVTSPPIFIDFSDFTTDETFFGLPRDALWELMRPQEACRSDSPPGRHLDPVFRKWQRLIKVNADLLTHISLGVLGTGKSLLLCLP